MTNELERIWKEMMVNLFEAYASICHEGLKNDAENLRIADASSELRNLYLNATMSV
jgi:hypothetical protein